MIRQLLIYSILSAVLIPFAHAKKMDAEDLMNKADEARMPRGSIIFEAEVKVFEDGSEINDTVYKVWSKDRTRSLVETIFPERQKGRKLLMDGDNLWFTTPNVKRAARVSMQQRLSGEVANGDLARTNYAGEYDAELVKEEKVDSHDTYRLLLKANRKGVTYSKIEYWIRTDNYQPVKAVYYALSGKALKTAEFSDVKNVFGKPCVTKITFTDSTRKSRKSVLLYRKHERSKIPESVLSRESLSE